MSPTVIGPKGVRVTRADVFESLAQALLYHAPLAQERRYEKLPNYAHTLVLSVGRDTLVIAYTEWERVDGMDFGDRTRPVFWAWAPTHRPGPGAAIKVQVTVHPDTPLLARSIAGKCDRAYLGQGNGGKWVGRLISAIVRDDVEELRDLVHPDTVIGRALADVDERTTRQTYDAEIHLHELLASGG